MSLEGINAARSAMLAQLNQNKSDPNGTAELFSNILSSQLSASTGSQADSQSVMPELSGDDWVSLLLASLLYGGSPGLMMQSLGAALTQPPEGQPIPCQTTYQTAAAAYSPAAWTGAAVTPVAASKPVTPAVTSHEGNRSPGLYRQVIDQFSVQTNPRYAVNKKGHGDTYCNIFLWDVTSAMGAEIPHYVDAKTGAPRTYPNVEGARELSANGIYNWLGEQGSRYGWFQVTPEQAQTLANQGRPVVTALKKSGHGHVQVVCPSEDGAYNENRGVTVAQAGRRLTGYKPITSIYNDSLPKVVYYAHA